MPEAVNYRVFDGLLIHPVAAFEVETILSKAQDASDAIRMEAFAWMLEIIAQLNLLLGEDFVVRGGLNTQLRLEPGLQRGSNDIDGFFHGSMEQLQDAFDVINQKFSGCNGYFQFERNVDRLFPPEGFFAEWTCIAPASFGGNANKGASRQLKVEVSFSKEAIHSVPLTGIVFGFELVSEVRGLSLGGLLGDKLLTLAKNTTGIKDHPERLARQIYDLVSLSENSPLSEQDFIDMATVIRWLVPMESSYRGVFVGEVDVLDDAINSMLELGQEGFGKDEFQTVNAWQGTKLDKSQRRKVDGWNERAFNAGMLAKAALKALELPKDAYEFYQHSQSLALRATEGDKKALLNALSERTGQNMNKFQSKRPLLVCRLAILQLGVDEVVLLLS